MPAIYEMLPFNSESLFINPEGEIQSFDLSSIDTWVEHGFSIFQTEEWEDFKTSCQFSFPDGGPQLIDELNQQFRQFIQSSLYRGLAFQESLQKVDWNRISSEIYVVAGNCRKTLSQIQLTAAGTQTRAQIVESRLINEHYWLSDRGDGTVLASAALTVMPAAKQVLTGCFRHRTMPNDAKVRQFILDNL